MSMHQFDYLIGEGFAPLKWWETLIINTIVIGFISIPFVIAGLAYYIAH